MQFLGKYGFQNTLTIPLIVMALFVAYLNEEKYAAGTIVTFVSAINFVHRLYGMPPSSNAFLMQKAIAGVKNYKATIEKRLPITVSILHRITSALEHTAKSVYQTTIYKSMFLLAFAAFLRVGETTASNKNTENVLKLGDLHKYTNSDGIMLKFKHFKHSKGRLVSIKVPRRGEVFCPVDAVESYLVQRRSFLSEFVFCWLSGERVKKEQFDQMLKTVIKFIGLDSQVYTSHSFGIGAACHAISLGYSDAQIREMGRWQSDAFKSYFRL